MFDTLDARNKIFEVLLMQFLASEGVELPSSEDVYALRTSEFKRAMHNATLAFDVFLGLSDTEHALLLNEC